MRKENSASADLSLCRMNLRKPVLRTESFPRTKCMRSRNGMRNGYARNMSRKACWSIRPASSKAAVSLNVPESHQPIRSSRLIHLHKQSLGMQAECLLPETWTMPVHSSMRPGAVLRRLRKPWPYHPLKDAGNDDGKRNRAPDELAYLRKDILVFRRACVPIALKPILKAGTCGVNHDDKSDDTLPF